MNTVNGKNLHNRLLTAIEMIERLLKEHGFLQTADEKNCKSKI